MAEKNANKQTDRQTDTHTHTHFRIYISRDCVKYILSQSLALLHNVFDE